ncbi:MAG: polysaccharide biosynthesis tyrosine autokinase [Paraburkholderia sp.]|uniref:polysaccharide biosynthesis tyrosine autokinase n=1 Tax=Paraburkholderia sp. TaxID=1926495 RepID=UPI0012017227|nr:polysaccharide biosynthesis tyrosine autokinase [Paraburkholderia sp.]TAL93418.1 MAG: polysaccharide biosynthesis tyrosine autokinase [Paraburkholderia sp.]
MSSVEREIPAPRDELDLVAVIDTVVQHRWSILFVTLVVALAGTAWAFLSHPVYQADILVQVEDGVDGGSTARGLLGDVSSLFDVKSSAAAEAQVMKSRRVVTGTVDSLKLYIDIKPKRFPLIGDFVSRFNEGTTRPGVLGMGGYTWGQESADVARFDVPRNFEDDHFSLTMGDGGRYRLAGSDLDTQVEGVVGTTSTFSTPAGPVTLLVNGFDAQPGARFTLVRHSRIDTIFRLQDALDVQEKVKQSDVVVATLRGDDPVSVARTLQTVGELYLAQNIERKAAEAAQSLAFLNGQLPELKKHLDEASQRYTAMRNASGTVDLPEEAKLALQQAADSKTQMLMLQQKRAELATRFNAAHPAIVALDRQIGALREQQGRYDASLKRLPDLEQEAVRLTLDVKVDTDLYTALLNNVQQLQLVRAGKVGSVRLVDSTVVAQTPVAPNRPVVIAGAAMVGLLLGLIYAFARDHLFGGVTQADDIERCTGLPVLATIPFSNAQRTLHRRLAGHAGDAGKAHVLALDAPDDLAIESLRSLRTAMQFSVPGGTNQVLMITSAAPAAGKSFVAANLGAVLASGGKRVLVIDGDLRLGVLNQYFGLEVEAGFSDLVAGSADERAVVRRAGNLPFDFIGRGTIVGSPDGLLQSAQCSVLIDRLRQRYDYVLIDTPPLLAVADAALIGRHADAVIVVARAGVTRNDELRETVKRLSRSGVKASGIVLNALAVRSLRYGSANGYGGYRYVDYAYGRRTRQGRLRALLDAWRTRRRR